MAEVEREKLMQTITDARMQMFEAMHSQDEPEFMGLDLTMPQFKILYLLYRRGRLRMTRLAELLGKNISTATGVVDRLVDEKLIKREEDPEDRRAVVVRLTEKGHELCESFMQQSGLMERAVMARLSLEELQIVVQAMEIMTRACLQDAKERGLIKKAEDWDIDKPSYQVN